MLVLTKQVEQPAEIVVSVVDEVQSAALNACYRERAGATNVLSFPDKVAVEGWRTLLGDIVVCYPVAAREAVEQLGAVSSRCLARVCTEALRALCAFVEHEGKSQFFQSQFFRCFTSRRS